jgi:hypothetical protein
MEAELLCARPNCRSLVGDSIGKSPLTIQVEGNEQGTRELIADGDRCEDHDAGVGACRFWHPVVKDVHVFASMRVE